MNHEAVEIKDIDALLFKNLPPKTTIKSYVTSSLVAPGENYGSLLISITVELEENVNHNTNLHLVAKMIPENKFIQKLFNTQVTFKREIAMYEIIAPTLIDFQLEQGVTNVISCLPKCFGARVSLNSDSNVVDNDAVILLENLTYSGYILLDRIKGFDLDTTKLLIEELATLHAIPVAIKTVRSDLFKSKVLPHLSHLDMFADIPEDVKTGMINGIITTAKLSNECLPLIPKVLEGFEWLNKYYANRPTPREPFATIVHNDFWLNNAMIKMTNNKPVKAKILDFQFIEYDSPGHDIVFFLYTSVQPEVLNLHFRDFLDHYYSTFISTLKKLKCDTDAFSYALFLQEIEDSAKVQFGHILQMLHPILTPKGKALSITDFAENNTTVEHGFVSEEYSKRVPEVILDFHQKQWI